MNRYDIVVIGAGAAGLMAAGRAAQLGAKVLLLEHKGKPGRKLAITGKGRCNLTNTVQQTEFLKHFYPHGRFLRNAFSRFFAEELIAHFKALGVETVVERGGRVFPESGQAPEIVKSLVDWNRRLNVKIRTSSAAIELVHRENAIQGVAICAVTHQKNKVIKSIDKSEKVSCGTVILATGGKSYPATGSTGDGYQLLKNIGHTIIKPRPALVPLEVGETKTGELDGLLLKNIEASVWSENRKISAEFGEMSFTGFGLTGPVILKLSHLVVDLLDEGKQVEIRLDLKPALDSKKLDERLIRELANGGKQQISNILKTLLPRQMIGFCLENQALAAATRGHEINARERKNLRNWFKELTFPISGYRPFAEAIITSGGVNLHEVNPKTMESRKVKGLFIAGEVLDIQADTGGYNLQAAFSTGWLAAESAFKTLGVANP